MKSVKYLEMLKEKHQLNDAGAASKLHLSKSAISQYASGKRVMDDETCLALAIELGLNPLEIIGAACIDRAEKTGQKSLFEVFMTRMAATASALLVAVFVTLFLTPIHADAATPKATSNIELPCYKLCEIIGSKVLGPKVVTSRDLMVLTP